MQQAPRAVRDQLILPRRGHESALGEQRGCRGEVQATKPGLGMACEMLCSHGKSAGWKHEHNFRRGSRERGRLKDLGLWAPRVATGILIHAEEPSPLSRWPGSEMLSLWKYTEPFHLETE